MKEVVNLRQTGTDPNNPRGGKLLGTATLDMPDQRFPDDEPKLISWQGRMFLFVQGTFAFGSTVPAEYVEFVPVAVPVDLVGASVPPR